MRIPIAPHRLISSHFPPLCALKLLLALAAAATLFGPQALAAQVPSASPAPASTHKTLHKKARPSAAHPAATPQQPAPAPVAPPVPEPPHWPANDKPAQASVVWDSQGLRIDAANSSLQQILTDVTAATGAEVQGLTGDERIFGVYGPGLARDVLSQLLQGSGYNVLMVGDQGQGAPRQILLSSRNAANALAANKSNANSDDDSADNDAEEQPQPQPQAPPTNFRPAFGPGASPRSPQQIMQDMQQRQQQMQNNQPPR